jgi:hypothetical protein
MNGLIDGSLSTLAPIFAVAFATHQPHYAFFAGLSTAIGAGVSMAFSEGLSDSGDLTGRGNPLLRGKITGVGTFLGGVLTRNDLEPEPIKGNRFASLASRYAANINNRAANLIVSNYVSRSRCSFMRACSAALSVPFSTLVARTGESQLSDGQMCGSVAGANQDAAAIAALYAEGAFW